MTVTVERYLKVVHPFWSKRNLKQWMIYAAMAFAWIAGILSVAPVEFVSTAVVDGICMPMHLLKSPAVEILSTWYMISYFVVPVLVFVFCYARIVVVMQRQMRVMAAHNVEGSSQTSAAQMQNKRIKWNIVKTMMLVLCPDHSYERC